MASNVTHSMYMVYNDNIIDVSQLLELLGTSENMEEDSGLESEEDETQGFDGAVLMTKPFNKNLNTKAARYKTFETWPLGLKQTKDDMVDAGFYYSGYGDRVECFYCGVILCDWWPEDEAWRRHIKANSECAYVLMRKKDDFIDDILKDKEINKEEIIKTENIDTEDSEHTDNSLCVTCMDNTRNMCLLPCKHVILCGDCLSTIPDKRCPMCRQKISLFVPVFLN
ncbi:iap [Cryptophlebia leucotreta granulovirus]|uniref:Iap n=1 Tax=Cryptophlebia leucotreta granulosis virus TaxID=35254 RepID=Q7T5K8_GVCL|nr:iap [Cryptophlebia leucotreta granulovirus]AAQ21680.1 iap [Cryptophlebia leucotreta granulovirus]